MSERATLFSDLAPQDAQVLLRHGSARSYPAHSVLINEGDETDALYVIEEGEVKVYASDDEGREVILNILGPGEYFGELALVDDAPRSASVMTLKPTRVVMISKAQFKQCLADNPEVAYNLIAALARHVRALTHNVKSLALMDVYGRIAHTLLDLAEERDGKLVVNRRLTHQELASMVGASREMVSRILKDLTRGGYISIENRIITINERLPHRW